MFAILPRPDVITNKFRHCDFKFVRLNYQLNTQTLISPHEVHCYKEGRFEGVLSI